MKALRQKPKELGMGPTQVEIEISPNVLDVLTIMPKSEKRFSEELIDKQYGL